MSNYSSDSEKRISNPPYDHHESDDDDDDDSGDDDTGSLADLTNYSRGSQGSGVELHPHHSKRGLRHGGGGGVSTNQYSAAGHHQLGSSDSRH
eukprot:scaffold2872_cov80-Skeletonema_marinoi.AAC.3